jgi:polyisoprenoid-binding protein YceI
MNRKIAYGIALAIAIPLVVVAGFGLNLLSHAHKLPWQDTPTRIPVTPFANLPTSADSPTAVTSGALTSDYDYDTGSYGSDPSLATGVPTVATDSAAAGYGADYGSGPGVYGDSGTYGSAGADGSGEAAALLQASSAASPATDGSPAASPEGAITFAIVGDQSEAKMTVHQKLVALPDPNDAVLSTSAFRGQLVLGFDGKPTDGSTIQVDLRTLKSDEPDRDNFIRGNTLQSDQFPIAEYAITGVEDWAGPLQEGQQATFKTDGQMTIHGTTKPVTFDTTATLNGDAITGTATTSFKFQDFGMSAPDISGFVKAEDTIKLEVTITATKS